MTDAEKFFRDWDAGVAEMRAHAPDVLLGFGRMFKELMKEGALSVREKELVALGIALSLQCVPCVNLHVQKCLAAGADREQVLEAAGVAVVMQGGPAFTHVPEVIRALDHLGEAGGGEAR